MSEEPKCGAQLDPMLDPIIYGQVSICQRPPHLVHPNPLGTPHVAIVAHPGYNPGTIGRSRIEWGRGGVHEGHVHITDADEPLPPYWPRPRADKEDAP